MWLAFWPHKWRNRPISDCFLNSVLVQFETAPSNSFEKPVLCHCRTIAKLLWGALMAANSITYTRWQDLRKFTQSLALLKVRSWPSIAMSLRSSYFRYAEDWHKMSLIFLGLHDVSPFDIEISRIFWSPENCSRFFFRHIWCSNDMHSVTYSV